MNALTIDELQYLILKNSLLILSKDKLLLVIGIYFNTNKDNIQTTLFILIV